MIQTRPTSKILFCGAIHGNFTTLIDRYTNIEKMHGPFEAIYSSGIAFRDGNNNSEWDLLTAGQLKMPCPLLILGPQKPEHVRYYGDVDLNKGGRLCENIFCLGRVGLSELKSGYTIAYISVTPNPKGIPSVDNRDFVQMKTVIDRTPNFKGVDVFITPLWPKSVTTYAPLPTNFSEIDPTCSLHLSYLSKLLRPRYHLASIPFGDHYCYERIPYRNPKTNRDTFNHCTLFINLAPLNNPRNDKWLYALNIVPFKYSVEQDFKDIPTTATENPFIGLHEFKDSRRYNNNNSNSSSGYSQTNNSAAPSAYNSVQNLPKIPSANSLHLPTRSKTDSESNDLVDPSNCWFCLSNVNCERHLIIYQTSNCYISLAKGGVVPHHLLIIPKEHISNSACLSKSILKEIEDIKGLLRKLFRVDNKSTIFFENNYHSRHMQIQCIPVSLCDPVKLENVFINQGTQYRIEFVSLKPNGVPYLNIVKPNEQFLVVEFENGTTLLHKIINKFPIFFARKVVISPAILGLPDYRVDWRKCILRKEDETNVISLLTHELQKLINTSSSTSSSTS